MSIEDGVPIKYSFNPGKRRKRAVRSARNEARREKRIPKAKAA